MGRHLIVMSLLNLILLAVGLNMTQLAITEAETPTVTPTATSTSVPLASLPMPSFVASPQPSVVPPTQLPAATLDPRSFDMSTATIYKSSDGLVEIALPYGWTRLKPYPKDIAGIHTYVFTLINDLDILQATITIAWGDATTIYRHTLNIMSDVSSPKAALEAMSQDKENLSTFDFGTIQLPSPGVQGLSLRGHTIKPIEPGSLFDIRLAELPDGQVLAILSLSRDPVADKAQPVLDQMIDTLVIHPKLPVIITQTATSTLLTATPKPSILRDTPTATGMPSPTVMPLSSTLVPSPVQTEESPMF